MTSRAHLAGASILVSLLLSCASGAAGGGRASEVDGDPERGREVIGDSSCGSCHSIPGVDGADAVVAPPLDGFASRSFVAGRAANEPDELVTWLLDPQDIDPRTAMPDPGLTPGQARDVAAYLYTLE